MAPVKPSGNVSCREARAVVRDRQRQEEMEKGRLEDHKRASDHFMVDPNKRIKTEEDQDDVKPDLESVNAEGLLPVGGSSLSVINQGGEEEGAPKVKEEDEDNEDSSFNFQDVQHALHEEKDEDFGVDAPMDEVGDSDSDISEVEEITVSSLSKEVGVLKMIIDQRDWKIEELTAQLAEREKKIAKLQAKNDEPQSGKKMSESSISEGSSSEDEDVVSVNTSESENDSPARPSSPVPGPSSASQQTKEVAIDLENMMKMKVLKVVWMNSAKSFEEMMPFLNCRLVCKTWKNEMDSLIKHCDPIKKLQKTDVRLDCEDVKEVEAEVTGIINSYKKNKNGWGVLQPRKLRILDFYGTKENILRSKTAINILLQTYGAEIEVFGYFTSTDPCRISFPEWYTTFQSWILLMPNLRTLGIFCLDPSAETLEIGIGLPEFQKLARIDRFPKLKKLTDFKTLTCSSWHPLMTAVMKTIFQANAHIKCVDSAHLLDMHLEEFSKLPKFKRVFCDADEFSCIASLSAMKPFVEEICISFQLFRFSREGDKCSQLLASLNEFENLKKLHIKISFPRLRYGPLLIPNLRILVLENMVCGDSSDQSLFTDAALLKVVGHLKSLESLEITNLSAFGIGWFENPRDTKRNQWRECLEHYILDRLWETLPSLKQVQIQIAFGKFKSVLVEGLVAWNFSFIREKEF